MPNPADESGDCMALVEQSPAAVAAHDKAAWLGLFASAYVVEDPVGSRPHMSAAAGDAASSDRRAPLSRFYDTFIAPNDIRFQVDRDIVCGLHVVRDLTIEITMSPEVRVCTPVHLLYELAVENGELKIRRLAAHWELWPMLKQQMTAGRGSLVLGASLGWRMLRNLGVPGLAGFLGALSGVGAEAKARAADFVRLFNEQREQEWLALFRDPDVPVDLPGDGLRGKPSDVAAMGGQFSCDKLIAAGNVVSASIYHRAGGTQRAGVIFLEFERRSVKIVSLALYLADQAEG